METWDIPRLRGVTHAYAFFVAVIAAALLIALTPGGAPRMAATVYGVGLCALFGGSGLYHRWRWNPRWRPVLRRVDHSTIYLFIAASYTPVGWLVLSGTTQWIVLITVWSGALAGVTISVAWINAPRAVCALCYVALGWVAVLAFPQLHAELPMIALLLVALGGAALHDRRDHLRDGAPEPVARGVRLPRDLPRLRDPGRDRALHRDGRLDRAVRA